MLYLTGNAPENPQVESSNVKIGKVSFEKTKRACEASGEFEKERRLNVSNRKPAEYKVTVIEGDLSVRISKYPATFI
jgi:hypothetical protein